MTVRDIITTHGPAYLKTYADTMPCRHRKTIKDIIGCRTPVMGTVLYRCNDCHDTYEIACSCGNRHCPTCQGDKAIAWLEKKLDSMLPVNHFMITFTVPSVFRDLFRGNQKILYSALFEAASRTMMRLASENTYFKGDLPGFFGVLHTWGRTMQYHPHIHFIVPCGAFDSTDHSWHDTKTAFYLPVHAMSKLVKQKMFSIMRREKLLTSLPSCAWQQDWNVNSQSVGSGERSIRYLSSYVFRTAISDNRILDMSNNRVAFRYSDTKTGTCKTMQLTPTEFIRRFL